MGTDKSIRLNQITMNNKHDFEYQVSNLFTEVRLSKGLTQAQLATKLGTKQPAIAMWEGCSRLPSLKTLVKLAEIAGKDLIIELKLR